ncbi:MAG: fimbrial biogenesis chaperone [Burkholderiales bacterium]
MFRRALGQAIYGLAFLLGAAAVATAGSFAVNPVRATLSSKQPVGSLVVRNSGTESTVIQLEVVAWTQEDGKDVYTSTKELLATPPIFTVPAGGSQVVRVGLRRSVDSQRELAYRLFLQEVPPAKTDVQGLRVVLRIGVPVFVIPPVRATPVLRWQASRTSEGALRLSLRNDGNAHIQVAKSKLMLPTAGQPLVTQEVATYVLSGQSRDWIYTLSPLPAAGAPLRVAAQTDAGDVQAEVVVE